jgi:hypothetical protein
MMDNYKVTRMLGEGTFGRVLEAERKGKRYAIKVNINKLRSSSQYKDIYHLPRSKNRSLKQ